MKKILIPIGLAFLALTLISAKKAFEIDDIVEKLRVSPADISGIDISWERVKAKIKMEIFNDSIHELNVNTLGLITIKELLVYNSNGIEIATANVNQSSINLPAKGAWKTDWIEVRVPLINAFDFISSSTSFDDYNYKLVIEFAGFGKYTIG